MSQYSMDKEQNVCCAKKLVSLNPPSPENMPILERTNMEYPVSFIKDFSLFERGLENKVRKEVLHSHLPCVHPELK